MNDPAVGAARESAAVAEAALALSGHKLDAFSCELTAKRGRRELTGGQAVEAIITRLVAAMAPASGSGAPGPR